MLLCVPEHPTYAGSLQVHGLRPGRRYAFRLVCLPVVLPPLTTPPSQPSSQPVAFATPATVPIAPQPVTLSGRGRTNLTVSSPQSFPAHAWRMPPMSSCQGCIVLLVSDTPHHVTVGMLVCSSNGKSLKTQGVETYSSTTCKWPIQVTPKSHSQTR